MKKEDTAAKDAPKKEEAKKDDKQPEKQAEAPQANQIVLMKKGDYSIHILIEEIKECLPLDKKSDQLPTPIVKITCFDKSQRTEPPELPCTDYAYGEHFYFEKTNLTVEQLDSSKIIIEVYDSNKAKKREDFFGIYEFDVEYIYNQPHHSLQNFWLALANPEGKDMTAVRGFLKLSASVLHDNDPRVELTVKEGDDKDCVIPSQIKMEYRMVSFNIFKGEELPDMDSMFFDSKVNRACDGFIEVKYLGLSKKTSVVKMVNDVVQWNEVVDIPVSIPAVSQKMVLLVKDHDMTGDDLVGSIEIKVSDIFQNKYPEMEYFNIYGSPLNKTGGYYDQMNNNAEIGSKWKGRILMKIAYQNSETPAAKTRKIEDQALIKAAANLSRKNLWSVYVKLYSAFYLPDKKEKYSIRVRMQDTEVLFPEKTAINGNIEWQMFKTIQCQSLSTKPEELPDIYIYLCNSKGEQICFQRIKPKAFHLNDKVMIIKLLPDPCFGKVNELWRSGLVKVKIGMINKAIDPPMPSLAQFKDGDSMREDEDSDLEAIVQQEEDSKIGLKDLYTIVANVYMSRYIMSSDSNGSNDPYVTLNCIDNEQKTSIKYSTVNGIWNEKLIFDSVALDINNKSTWPILLLRVLDYDQLSSDDLLGYSYLWLSDAHYSINQTELVKPKWHKIFLPKSNKQQGEVLISFYIFDSMNRNKMHEINSIPETIPYSCEINILGLRDLKPLSLLPVKKSYITFDMNSLNVTGKAEDSLQPIKTQPKDSGENPTINTVIKFDIKLPKDDIFMPELQCQIYDHLLSGIINPQLGIFLLNLGQLSRETSKQIDEDIRTMQGKIGLMMTQGLIQKQIFGPKDVPKDGGLIEEDSPAKVKGGKPADEVDPDDVIIVIKSKKTKVVNADYSEAAIEKNKDDPSYYVILPQYKSFIIPGTKPNTPNYREYEIEDLSKTPSDTYYFPIGYIKKPEKEETESGELIEKDYTLPENITKHYRRIYRRELERNPELGLRSPFYQSFVRRGKDEDKSDELAIFTSLANENNKIIKTYLSPKEQKVEDQKKAEAEKKRGPPGEKGGMRGQGGQGGPGGQGGQGGQGGVPHFLRNRMYGKFKGVIRVCEKQKMNQYLKMINDYRANDPSMIQELKNLNKYENLTRSILVKAQVIIRVYILELNDLAKKDQFSESDPYIKIFLGGKQKFNEQKNRQDDQKNCKWYKYYDILSDLPGDSSLRVEAWDYDPIFRDEMIGATTIDLEDRFFNEKWQAMKFKPIEIRSLRHPDISSLQGSIYMWVEIFEKKDRIDINPWQIAPEPETTIEMRLIIWETEDMKCLDVEGTSDIYINAYVNPEKKQSTDTHFRCQTGIGSFNWRVVMPISLPKDNKVLTLQAYDNDIFARDDFICGATIDLRDIIKIPKDLDVPIVFNQEYVSGLNEIEKKKYENIQFLSKSDDPDMTKFWVQCHKNNAKEGRILCSLEFLPMWKAEISKVGLGRDEPNVAPYLPPPFGRFEWSLNPFKMLNQCVGPRFRAKLYCIICLICLSVYLAFLIPYLILHLSGEVVNPFNYVGKNTK